MDLKIIDRLSLRANFVPVHQLEDRIDEHLAWLDAGRSSYFQSVSFYPCGEAFDATDQLTRSWKMAMTLYGALCEPDELRGLYEILTRVVRGRDSTTPVWVSTVSSRTVAFRIPKGAPSFLELSSYRDNHRVYSREKISISELRAINRVVTLAVDFTAEMLRGKHESAGA